MSGPGAALTGPGPLSMLSKRLVDDDRVRVRAT